MLGLPSNTEVNKQLPKTAIFRLFDSNSLPRERFDDDISRIVIVNELSSVTLNVAEGNNVKSIFALNVMLKRKDYDSRNIIALNKLIPQKMLFVLQKDDTIQLAVVHTQLITSDWYKAEEYKIQLAGLNLNTIWDNIVKQVGNIKIEDGNSLTEQIAVDAERAKKEKQIALLEKQCRLEKQTRKKYELHKLLLQLKEELNGSI